MSWINDHRTPSRRELRSFGFILAIGFLVISMIPFVFRRESPHIWAIAVATISAVGAVAVPSALKLPYRFWMTLGMVLGWINSRIILAAIYYLLITPIRLILKIRGRDPLNRSFDRTADTYRVIRKPRPGSHMERQF